MIKINLLKNFAAGSVEVVQGMDDQSSPKIQFFKHIIVMFLGVAALFGYESYNIPELTGQLNVIQNEINEASAFNQKMGGLKKEIEKYEADLKKINFQTEFLQKVQKERILSMDLINKMKEMITPKIWLSSIQALGSSIEIKGEAESISDVNEFNNRLSTATYLKDVLTTSIEQKYDTKINLQLQNFNIKASYVDGKQLIDNEINMQKGDTNE